jgi:hypothetical protein
MTDWIEWSGGERPPPPDALVEVRSRNYVNRVGLAGVFEWRGDDVLLYRFCAPGQHPWANGGKR